MNHFTSSFTDDPDHYADDNPNNRAAKNVIDDNFDEIKVKLNQPTSDDEVEAAVEGNENTDVILWRGTSGSRSKTIVSAGSAGGAQVNAAVSRPSNDVAQQQIGIGRSDGFSEFTAKTDLGFSFQHWLVVVKINSKYLTRGSSNEEGWVCANSAPVEVLDTVDRTLGFIESMGANGS